MNGCVVGGKMYGTAHPFNVRYIISDLIKDKRPEEKVKNEINIREWLYKVKKV